VLAHVEAGGQGLEFGAAFLALALESAPALLLAYVAGGLLQVFLGESSLAWLGRGGRLSQALRGAVVGLPLPLCSCGVLPLYQSLTRRGLAPTAALSFLVAAPEIGLGAAFMSLPLLGLPFTLARVGAALLVALLTGILVGRLASARLPASPPLGAGAPVAAARAPLAERVRAGLRAGLVELVDHTAPWVLLGLALAALLEPLLDPLWLASLPQGWDVLLLALLGMPSYVCASGATPLVAVLLHKGLSPGAALAFLLTGPATNVTTFGVLARLHGRRLAFAFALAVGGASVLLGLGLNALLPAAAVAPAHLAGEEAPGLLEVACLGALALLVAGSLVRQGPAGFLAQLLPGAGGGSGGARGGAPQGEAGAPPQEALPAPRLAGALHVHGPHCRH
jgi:uncharacterized membrane protein YraQ (UPF0718 family)